MNTSIVANHSENCEADPDPSNTTGAVLSPSPDLLQQSYQQSPERSSFGSNKSASRESKTKQFFRIIMASTLRRFSIEAEGYENPPQAEEFEDEENFGPSTTTRPRNNNISGTQTNVKHRFPYRIPRTLVCTVVLFAVLLVCAIWGYIETIHLGQGAFVYTGDQPVCEREETPLQGLKSFSTLEEMEHGVVAADHPQCSAIGLSMMRDLGGNAVDAAVATALCLGVANPSSSGIGGGAFILIHAEEGKNEQSKKNFTKFHDARTATTTTTSDESGKVTEVIDCREVAGEAASTLMFEEDGVPPDASLVGGLAVAVPGELRGLELAHARHGRLDWATVVRPAMELARDGVPVYTHLAHDIEYFQKRQKYHGGLPSLRKLLTRDDNWDHILKEGELLKNSKLAETLQAVMEQGADALYVGSRAEQLANEIQKAGGILTKSDIENYQPTLRSPVISDNVFGFHVVGVPPPSSGGAVIIGALRFLAGYATPLASFADTLGVHRMVEALKHVFAIRMTMSDPAFPLGNDVPNSNATSQDAVDALIQGNYMEELRQVSRDDGMLNLSQYGGPKFAQLNDNDGNGIGQDAKEGDRRRLRTHGLAYRRLADPFGYLDDHGTSHLSVVDADGNAVAITTSVNAQFGSGLVSESTGVLLNNQMDDFGNPGKANYFGLKPSKANFILPGKKPLSSMSPMMVFRARQGNDSEEVSKSLGDLRLVVGGSGGPKIITAVFQVIVNHLLIGKPLFEAMAHPRIHDQLLYHGTAATTIENSVVFPSGINLAVSNRTRTALAQRGHQLIEIDYAGTIQAVAVDSETGKLDAVCDIRKGGSPVGY